MFPDVKSVRYMGNHLLELKFADGVSGVINFAPLIVGKGEMFAALEDTTYFARASVNEDIGTVVWPNGLDFDPDVLYSQVTGKQIPVDESHLLKR